MDKRRGSHVDIKVEVDSDHESTEGTTGQSSFDLAMNKPDVNYVTLYVYIHTHLLISF